MADKTFTQEEVNTIVQDRLAKEKAKYEKQISDLKADIAGREKRMEARVKLREKGLPEELAELVKIDDDESFNNSLGLLEAAYKKETCPTGGSGSGNSGTQKGSGYSPMAGGMPNPENDIRRAMGLKI